MRQGISRDLLDYLLWFEWNCGWFVIVACDKEQPAITISIIKQHVNRFWDIWRRSFQQNITSSSSSRVPASYMEEIWKGLINHENFLACYEESWLSFLAGSWTRSTTSNRPISARRLDWEVVVVSKLAFYCRDLFWSRLLWWLSSRWWWWLSSRWWWWLPSRWRPWL